MDQKTQTLFGAVTVPVTFEDSRTGELTVRQLKLKQYPPALRLLDDEFGLLALACDVKRGIIEALHPDSYEAALARFKELNAAGFFIFAARQQDRAAVNLRNLPPELLEKFISSKLSPASPPAAA